MRHLTVDRQRQGHPNRQGRALSGASAYGAIFLVALLARLAVVAASTFAFEGWAPDDSTYSLMAQTAAAGEAQNWDPYTQVLYKKTLAFSGPLTLLYRVFGPSEVAGQIFVALLGATAAALVAVLARERLGTRAAVATGMMLALLPSQVIFSSLLLKDAAVWVALISIAFAMMLLRNCTRWKAALAVIFIVVALAALGHLREHTLVVAVAALSLSALYLWRSWGIARTAAVVALAIIIPWGVGIGPAGLTLVTNAGSLEERRLANAERARTAFVDTSNGDDEVARQLTATEAAAVKERARLEALRETLQRRRGPDPRTVSEVIERLETRVTTAERRAATLRERLAEASETAEEPGEPGALTPHLRHLPRGVFVMLLEPTPWGWSSDDSATLRLARLESLLWYPLLILAALGIPTALRNLKSFLLPILVGGGVLVMYALTEGNIGTAYRHRGELVWVVVLLAGCAVHSLLEQRAQRQAGK